MRPSADMCLLLPRTHPTPPSLSIVLFHHPVMPVGEDSPNEVPKGRAWVPFSVSLFCPRRDGKSAEGLATISWLSPFIPSAGMFVRTSVEKNRLECRVDRGFLWQVERVCSEEVWARIGNNRQRPLDPAEDGKVDKCQSSHPHQHSLKLSQRPAKKGPRRVQQMTLTSQLTRCTWATG